MKIKVLPWTWEDLTSFDELATEVDRVRRALLYVKATPLENPSQWFWSHVMEPWYLGDMSVQVSTVLYRLSEQVPEDIRVLTETAPWQSLEGWRRSFEESLSKGVETLGVVLGDPPEIDWTC